MRYFAAASKKRDNNGLFGKVIEMLYLEMKNIGLRKDVSSVENEIYKFELNQPVPEALKVKTGSETIWTDYDGSGMLNLYIAFPEPVLKEINAIEDGDIVLSFLAKNDIIFNFIQFRNKQTGYKIDAMEFIIEKHMQGIGNFDLFVETLNILSLPENNDSGIGLHVCLIDSNTRILKAQRLVGISNMFSRKFLKAIITTFESGRYSNALEVLAAVKEIQRNYSTKDLLKLATDVTIHSKK